MMAKKSLFKLLFMKSIAFVFIAVIFLFFQSCSAQSLSKKIENAFSEKLFSKFSGKCFLKETTPNSFLLLINSRNSIDSYDKAFVVVSESNQTKPTIDEQSTYEFFIPLNKRFVIIYNQKTDKIFVAGLSDQAASDAIERFKSNENIKSALLNQDVLGYGLSYLNNTIWNISKIKESKYKTPYYTLDYANMTNKNAALALAPPDDDTGGGVSCAQGTCTSGGAGSSSCSITESPLNQECSVTCNSGYYACCVSSTVRCYCCKIQ
jgi:hypothetical protein